MTSATGIVGRGWLVAGVASDGYTHARASDQQVAITSNVFVFPAVDRRAAAVVLGGPAGTRQVPVS